jgi:hypothetical protein
MPIIGLFLSLFFVVLMVTVMIVRLPYQFIAWALGCVLDMLAGLVVWAEGFGID